MTLILLFGASAAGARAIAPGSYYVKADSLNVRLAPAPGAPVAGQLKRTQKVDVYEVKNGWARLTEYYPSPSLGRNTAHWVSADYLVDQRPDPMR